MKKAPARAGKKTATVKVSRGRKASARPAAKTVHKRSSNRKVSDSGGRKKAFRAFLLVFLFLALGAGAGAGAKAAWSWLTTSERFAIEELVVRTGDRVSESEVLTLADLSEGDNILDFRLSDCVEAIEIHPWVARASVMRELPNRVIIDVEERRPVAVMALGGLYYLDGNGEIFKKVLPGEEMDYPVFTGISLREVVEDKESVDPMIDRGLEITRLSGNSRIMPEETISEIHLDRTYGATVVRTGDGMRIRFGRGEYSEKWKRLERTLAEMGGEIAKVAELDLNYDRRVTVKLKEGYRVASN